MSINRNPQEAAMTAALANSAAHPSLEELQHLQALLAGQLAAPPGGRHAPNGTPAAATPTEPATAGRDARGRFTAGNAGGCGNPFARQVASFRKALYEAVDIPQLKMLAERLWDMAFAGNVQAAKLLFQYLVGKPADVVDPDRLDADEWRAIEDSAVPISQWYDVLHKLPAGLATGIAEPAWPCVLDPYLQQLRRPTSPAETDEPPANTEERTQAGPSVNGDNGHAPPPPQPPMKKKKGAKAGPSANGSNGRAGAAVERREAVSKPTPVAGGGGQSMPEPGREDSAKPCPASGDSPAAGAGRLQTGATADGAGWRDDRH
jgi:hypothetical protein